MKEKVLSLAKGNFIYDAPRLRLTPERFEFQVVAGERQNVSFSLENERGTKIKGFGAVEETELEFLPVFHAEKNELTLEVNASECVPGEHLHGQILLVTECGETTLPYDIQVVSPEVTDKKGKVNDYFVLQERIQEDTENGARLFHDPNFKEVFLYRDERGKSLYDHLKNKDSRIHSMEEFLVACGKKKAIRFSIEKKDLTYDLQGEDVQDCVSIRINTWGSTGIHIRSTADFIEPERHVIWTDEFEGERAEVVFTILTEKVKSGRRYGSLILETPYETKQIEICAHHVFEEKERKIQRAKKAVIDTLYRTYLGYKENRISREDFQQLLEKNQVIIEKVSETYELAIMGYIQIMRKDEKEILEFYRQTEPIDIPKLGTENKEVENYILIEYIKFLYSKREEDKKRVDKLLTGYRENGYDSTLLFYLQLHTDERYQSVHLFEKDVRKQLENGVNSPLLYSALLRVFRQEPALITSLDEVTLSTISYGLNADLITEEIAVVFSFLAERVHSFRYLIFSMLEKMYIKFQLSDTLRCLCGMLIRNEMRSKKYHPWFAKGVAERLRLTDLYEYYMYTIDLASTFTLPDSILSYFQYENHLNETCKAFLYAYIIRKKEEHPENFRTYGTVIREFALKQLTKHRISEDIGIIYEGLFMPGNIVDSVAEQLPYVMFTHLLTCYNPKMDGVLVVHMETKEEKYYPFVNGKAKIQIFTPNYQLYFVNDVGNYFTGTIDFSMKKLLHLDDYATLCFQNGSTYPPLMIHLTVEAERGARMTAGQAEILHQTVETGLLRDYTSGKVLLRLYDYYKERRDTASLLEILDAIHPSVIKRERIGEVATDCIYHGMYEKAEKMLLRYGIRGCEKKALAMLVTEMIQKKNGEFLPILEKWALYLYKEHYFERSPMHYLLQFYMGQTGELHSIYKRCLEIPEVMIDDGCKERLLGQVLFTGCSTKEYEALFLDYYATGNNRVLVKAFLSEMAYEYIVGRLRLSEDVFLKIEKEALYEKEKVMILATLKYYSAAKSYAKKQQEFIELQLENFASEGLILTFMKEFIGKVAVPYEIENAVLIQYNSGTAKGVYLYEKKEDGSFCSSPMKQIFDGVFTKELLLFEGEEVTCYIYEEESDERTEEMIVSRPRNAGSSNGFFQMVNHMIEAKNSQDKAKYEHLRQQYERNYAVAAKLFTIQ